MRCLLLFLLLLLVPASVSSSSLPEAQTDFGLRLFSALVQDRSNRSLVFSPVGLTAVLSMVQQGAAGDTHRALTEALGYSLRERGLARQQRLLLAELDPVADSASGLFVERTLSLGKSFKRSLRKAFSSSANQVDLSKPEEARGVINAWVSDHTHGVLPELVPPGALSEETRLVLLTALHFHGRWRAPFDRRRTHERLFHCANGSSATVHMMRITERFQYGEFVSSDGLDYDVIEVPYQMEDIGLLLVSPFEPEVPLSALSTDLTSHTLSRWRQGMRTVKKQLSLPRFTLVSDLNMKKVLTDMGLGNMFNLATADFTRITTDEKLCVSQILQKVKLEVNEDGTEGAAAAAAVLFSRMAVDEITLDRPFLFLIQHKPTGAVLFMGQFNEPQSA